MHRSAIALALGASLKLFTACVSFQPESLDSVLSKTQVETATQDGVRVSAAVLTPREARRAFGVDLQLRWMQAIWIEVENHDDLPYWVLYPSIDPDYYSADEVAYSFRGWESSRTTQERARYLRQVGLRNPVEPGTTRSGFVFVNLDEDQKEVDVQLLSLEGVTT
jgi:hypothetical protein